MKRPSQSLLIYPFAAFVLLVVNASKNYEWSWWLILAPIYVPILFIIICVMFIRDLDKKSSLE